MHPLSPEIVWTSTFDSLVQQMRPCFVRQGTWHRMQSYLRGLLSPVKRKNGWRIAEEIGAVTPYGVQYLLDRAKWDENAMRGGLRASVYEALADPQAILILDETGFLKKRNQVCWRATTIQRNGWAHRKLSNWCLSRLRQSERICPH